MVELTEVFHSLQGEGPQMGRPAGFIRLSGCVEPYCSWCDTPEALLPGKDFPVKKILSLMAEYQVKTVIITGGEPFRQWHDGLDHLEKEILSAGYELHYETSGKLVIPSSSRGYIVCSPKHTDGTYHFRAENVGRIDAFKFVAEEDFNVIEGFIQQYKIPADKVWIMAKGATKKEQLARSAAVWNFCVANNYNYSARLHILTFDQQKGI